MKKVIVILVLCLLVAGLVAFLTKHYSSNISSIKPSVTPKPAGIVKTLPMRTAEQYFADFTSCMKKPPQEAAGQASLYCETHNDFTTEKLASHLKKQSDSIVCGQTPPQTVSAVRSTEINENQALVVLREDFGASSSNVTYQMQRENGKWKIENILCPK
jgi:hypothetical protein